MNLSKEIMDFVRSFNTISVSELDDITEYMADAGYLNEKGLEFRKDFWDKFIAECERPKHLAEGGSNESN